MTLSCSRSVNQISVKLARSTLVCNTDCRISSILGAKNIVLHNIRLGTDSLMSKKGDCSVTAFALDLLKLKKFGLFCLVSIRTSYYNSHGGCGLGGVFLI